MIARSFGVSLIIETGLDLSGATSITLAIINPNGHVFRKSASTLDATSGQILYVTERGVFGVPGVYSVQVTVNFGDEARLKSLAKELEVFESL